MEKIGEKHNVANKKVIGQSSTSFGNSTGRYASTQKISLSRQKGSNQKQSSGKCTPLGRWRDHSALIDNGQGTESRKNWKACDLGAGCDENDIVMVAVRNLRPTNRLAMRLIYNDRVPENESQVDSIPTIMKITALLNFVLWRFNFPPRARPQKTDSERPRDSCCFRWKFADIW